MNRQKCLLLADIRVEVSCDDYYRRHWLAPPTSTGQCFILNLTEVLHWHLVCMNLRDSIMNPHLAPPNYRRTDIFMVYRQT